MCFALKCCCVRKWEGRCRGVGVLFVIVDVCCIQSESDDLVCFLFYVRILVLGMCLGFYRCLTRRVVIALLSLIRGRCVDCIWGGVGVG